MSLPLVFGTTLQTIPPTPARWTDDPGLAAMWDKRLPPRRRPRAGLVWSGNAAYRQDQVRSIPFERLSPLFEAGWDLVSLQKEPPPGDEAALARSAALDVREGLSDFDDTAALIDRLDLVITVDTATAHLAGALGKPVWILLPHVPDWRWLQGRQDSPWHPSARLFRQSRLFDWDGVIDEVRRALGDTHQFPH
jgi:hypothetical protein